MKFINRFKLEILIFFLFILSRYPSLGHDMFNTDVWKWKVRTYDFSTGVFTLNFDQTIQKYHPGVTLMWLGTVGIKVFNLYNDIFLHVSADSIQALFGLHFVQKFLVVIAIGISLASIFYVLRELFGNRFAFLSIFLLSFEPFYIALTRTFHLEGLQSTFMLASIVWFYYWYEKNKKNYKRLFITAFFSAFSFLTKTTALYLVPFFGLWILLDILKNKKIKMGIFRYLQWILPTFMFVFLLWPALWVIPNDVFKILYQGVAVVGVEQDHIQFFFGKLVDDPGWYFYIVVFILRSSYLLLLGLLGLKLLFVFDKDGKFKKYLGNTRRDFIKYNLLYVFFYMIMLSIPSKKLDRYILPLMVSSVLICAFFFEYYLDKIKSNLKYLVFLLPLITAVYLHPDYFSYYSSGLKFGMYAIEPKWMIGQREVINYVEGIKEDKEYMDSYDMSFEEVSQNVAYYPNVTSVGFQEKYYTQIWPFFREFGAWAVIKDLTPFAVRTNYFVYPVWNDDSYNEDRFKIGFIGTIKVRGVDVYNVYQRVNP